MTSNPVARLGACAVILLAVGCRPRDADTTGVEVDLSLDPSPPVVGASEVTLSLASEGGEPLAEADVRVEGNMNHAGMKPSFADLEEVEPGRYTGTLEFTMGGDWFILVTAKTKDGRRVERKIDVPGVQRP